MQVPLIWRPAPSAGVAPAQITEPVGHLDLAPTFCAIAGVPAAEWMQGRALPTAPGSGRERVITEWDSQFAQIGMHLRTIYRDGYMLTVYEPSTRDWGFDLAALYNVLGVTQPLPDIRYDGSEGELYNLNEDPLQWRNLWSDPGCAKLKSDLKADLYDNLPPLRSPRLRVDSPV
jgi:arylsulfatase A-like enzyme